MACLPGIPPVVLRIVAGAPKGQPVMDRLQQRTDRLQRLKTAGRRA